MLKARQLACVSKSGQKCPAALSLSSWRAWIEIIASSAEELKYVGSLSSWRAWIEITGVDGGLRCCTSRSPHGERGLKCRPHANHHPQTSRSPHGERGLKYHRPCRQARPMRRSPHGERGLKSQLVEDLRICRVSLSSWRAWIEMPDCRPERSRRSVALLMESVD